jgi:amino-acid N-acetyltransferase
LVSTDDSGSIDGVVALERHGERDSTAYLLRSLAVRADRQGAGLGGELVAAATVAADADQGSTATIALLTETAVGYFERFGFRQVFRDQLPATLAASPELSGACAQTAQAYIRSV